MRWGGLITDQGTHNFIQMFRRRHDTMLFQKGEPVRLITWKEWDEPRKAWPEEIKADQLEVRVVRVLIPITN